jgi:hypothetical protein
MRRRLDTKAPPAKNRKDSSFFISENQSGTALVSNSECSGQDKKTIPFVELDPEQLAELIQEQVKKEIKKQEDPYHKIKFHLIEVLLLMVFLIEAGRYLWWLLFKH